MEEGIDSPGEPGVGRDHQSRTDDTAAEEGEGVQGCGHFVDGGAPSGADLPAHDDGGGIGDGHDGHDTDILNIAEDGPGGQDLKVLPSMWPMMTLYIEVPRPQRVC